MTAPNDVAALVERLSSHMGQADVGDLLRDCRQAAATIAALTAENDTLREDIAHFEEANRALASQKKGDGRE